MTGDAQSQLLPEVFFPHAFSFYSTNHKVLDHQSIRMFWIVSLERLHVPQLCDAQDAVCGADCGAAAAVLGLPAINLTDILAQLHRQFSNNGGNAHSTLRRKHMLKFHLMSWTNPTSVSRDLHAPPLTGYPRQLIGVAQLTTRSIGGKNFWQHSNALKVNQETVAACFHSFPCAYSNKTSTKKEELL